MHFKNKGVFDYNRRARCLRGTNYLKQAWESFASRQSEDEEQYTKGILDMNKLGVLFSGTASSKGWGRRAKDFVYGYWTEEDIRLKLATELSKLNKCQVHGQVHIRGRRSIRKYSRKTRYFSKYPDLFLIVLIEKAIIDYTKEKNIETTAIEIKYFGLGRNRRDLKRLISEDLDKLIGYQEKRLSPKVDCGYFFCIDETGYAGEVLRGLFKKPKYKKVPLGYGILIPRYALINVNYPRHFEKYERGITRKIAYLLSYIKGQLDYTTTITEEKYGLYFRLKKRPYGWLEITWHNYVKKLGGKYLAAMLRFKDNKEVLRNCDWYKWDDTEDRWIRATRSTGTVVLMMKINRKHLCNLENIEWYGKNIASKIKRKCIEATE